jgi:palmitoyltransferase
MLLLCVLILVNSITLFGVGIMLLRSLWSLCTNMTTIEGWEIERHEALLRRARVFNGYLDGPDGVKVRITRQEFPYDIGIWANVVQGMGGGLFTWFWPFSATPPLEGGLAFEVNGFEGQLAPHRKKKSPD